MKTDKLTTKSQEALREASELAGRNRNTEMYPEHFLFAALKQDQGIAAPIVSAAGGDVAAVESALEKRFEQFAKVSGQVEPTLSRRMLDALRKAEEEATQRKDEFVSVEHFLLALAKHDRKLNVVVGMNRVFVFEMVECEALFNVFQQLVTQPVITIARLCIIGLIQRLHDLLLLIDELFGTNRIKKDDQLLFVLRFEAIG